MKILTYSTLFPNAVDSNQGIFTQTRMLHYIECYGHTLQVVAPVPYFPRLPAFPRWYKFSKVPRYEVRQDISVSHPRYLVTPKVGMTLYGWNMFLGTLSAVKHLQRTFDFAVIDAHYLYPDAFAAVLLGQVLRKPVVVTAHGTDVHLFTQLRTIRPMLRFVLHRAAAVITVCQALKDSMMQLGVLEKKIRVISNGVDLSLFYPTECLTARRRLGLPQDKLIILSVARLTEVKGIHHLIEAVARLRQQRPELLLILVGDNNDVTYWRRLQEQIARDDLGDIVRFAGPQPHAALREWYNACDLFCLSSLREGWPCVLLEALACGKPVVASRVGGIPEVIPSTDYGLLVEPADSENLTMVLHTALNKCWEADKIAFYAKEHSWEKGAAKLQGLFEQVVSSTS